MKYKILIMLFFLSIYSNSFANNYIEKTILGHKIKVVKYNISGNEYNLKFVKSDNGTSLKDLIIENNGITGVNGVFFCPADYADCKGKENTTNNERYFDGIKYSIWETTGDRVVFGLDSTGKPMLFQTNVINPTKEGEIQNGFSNWPLLLKDGKNQLEYYWDINMVDAKMRAKMSRNFICNDIEKKNIYFGYVYDAFMDDMPIVLAELGCSDALNLDAGGSTAFIYNGKYILGPGRKIIDGIIIERKGLDVKSLIIKIDDIMKYIETKTNRLLTQEKKITYLEKLIKDFNNAKSKIYNLYSKDIIENKNGIEEINGYEVEINDINTLSRIYMLNTIISKLNILLYNIKK